MQSLSILYGVIVAQTPSKKVKAAEAFCLEKMEICWSWQFDFWDVKISGMIFFFVIPGKPPLLTHGVYLAWTEVWTWYELIYLEFKLFSSFHLFDLKLSWSNSSICNKGNVTEVEKAFQKYFELLAVYLIVDAHF